MRRATTFFSSTKPQPAGPGQSHVLGTVLQEQPDRCQTGHRQGKKRTENRVDKGRQGLSGSAPGGNEAGPPPGSAPTEPPAEDFTQQTSLLDTEPAEAAFPLPEPLLAQDGTVFLQELPKELLRLLFSLQPPLQDWLEANPEADAHAQLLELYFAVQDITRAAERYDAHFVTQLTARGSELEWELLCLDPAPFVDASLAAGRAAALFSATLTPPGYYRSVLGCPDARAVALESPFPPEHLGLYCLPGISTRYRDREPAFRPSRMRWPHWPGPKWATICLFSQLRLSTAGI